MERCPGCTTRRWIYFAPHPTLTFTTGNKPIQVLKEEKAALLLEKLLRIPGDQYWKTYGNKRRNPKTKNGFI